MSLFGHRIRRQTLELREIGEARALALRTRLGVCNRRRFLAVIEKVFDELDVPGRRVEIGRLDLDLGALDLDRLEEQATERLERALRRSLSEALAGIEARSTAENRWQTEGAARLELLEHFLRFGTLPVGLPALSAFSFEELFGALAQGEARGLAAILSRHGRKAHVLERLILLLDEAMRGRLVYLLKPEHAALIVAYLQSLREVHRGRPLVALGCEDFDRILWFLSLSFLLRDPGSQFNRKSYVRSLLHSLARDEGVEYHALLAASRWGLEETRKTRPIALSLPGVLGELARELSERPEDPASEGPRHLRGPLGGRAALPLQLPTASLQDTLKRHAPAAFATLQAVMGAIEQLPAPYRPRAAAVDEAFSTEVLRTPPRRVTDLAFFIRLLHRLFGRAPAPTIVASLRRRHRGWTASAGLPVPQVEAFATALQAVGGGIGDADGESAVPGEKAATAARAHDERKRLRTAVLVRLLGLEELGGGPEGQSPGNPRAFSVEALRAALNSWLEDSPAELERLIRCQAGVRRARQLWVKNLDEATLTRLSLLLRPRQHRAMFEAAETLASAWLEVAPRGQTQVSARSIFWDFILWHFARSAPADRSVERLLEAFSAHLAELAARNPPRAAPRSAAARWLDRADRLARRAGQSSLAAELKRLRPRLLGAWQAPAPTPEPALAQRRKESPERRRSKNGHGSQGARSAFGLWRDGELEEPEGALYIGNAGLVLAGPFLPSFFDTLGLLTRADDGTVRPRDRTALSRSVHLLQYLVEGNTVTPEPFLPLNKVLCGAPTSVPVAPGIEPSDRELEMCTKLLESILASWKILESTSIAGLRETFLQREGRLHHGADGWKLLVQRKTLDVLVDQVPWSLSVIFHRWMPEPLYVSW